MMDIQKYDYCNDTIKLKENIEQSFLFLGERLKKIRDEDLYKDGWASFEDYLDELDMNKSVASKLITVYETFSVKFPTPPQELITPKGWTNLYEIATVIKTYDDYTKWLSDWQVLRSSDLRIKVREAKSGVLQEQCKHEDSYLLRICRTCNARYQEYEEEKISKA